jgi:hypothetical protein
MVYVFGLQIGIYVARLAIVCNKFGFIWLMFIGLLCQRQKEGVIVEFLLGCIIGSLITWLVFDNLMQHNLNIIRDLFREIESGLTKQENEKIERLVKKFEEKRTRKGNM